MKKFSDHHPSTADSSCCSKIRSIKNVFQKKKYSIHTKTFLYLPLGLEIYQLNGLASQTVTVQHYMGVCTSVLHQCS